MAGCGSAAASGAAATPPTSPAATGTALAAGATPGASPTAAASATPSPPPTPPPLRKPSKHWPLRAYFGGDSLSGLPGILFAQRGSETGLMRVHTDYQVSSRLTNPAPVDWPQHLRSQMTTRYDVGIFMIGTNDPGMPMIAKGKFTMYPAKAWISEYARRAGVLMEIMRRSGVKRVYWVGMPVMPTGGATRQMIALDKAFKAEAARHRDVVYVDTFGLLSTNSGGYIGALRSGDGVHFTDAGAWRIAKAVWAAVKKDWQPAW